MAERKRALSTNRNQVSRDLDNFAVRHGITSQEIIFKDHDKL